MTSLQCSFCPYRSSARLDLIKHSFGSHFVEPSFRFVCGISGCVHCFRRCATFESFKSHVLRKHPRWQAFVDDLPVCEVSLPEVHAQNPAVGSPTDLLSSEPFQPLTDTTTLLDSPSDSRPDRTPSTPQHTAALFLLTFKEKYRLSQKAIDYAVGSINTIVDNVCLQVILYYDDVEPANPLGSYHGRHKLGKPHVGCYCILTCVLSLVALFYYFLGNIQPKLRSTLRCTQLLACVTTPNLEKYGFDMVLRPFIQDANKLSEVHCTCYIAYVCV